MKCLIKGLAWAGRGRRWDIDLIVVAFVTASSINEELQKGQIGLEIKHLVKSRNKKSYY